MIYELNKLAESVYHTSFESTGDLWKIFLRSQERYESPCFKNKNFSIEEYKRWYIEEYGSFSYGNDWHGFNVPDKTIKEALSFAPDWNEYDEKMLEILSQIPDFFNPNKKFYLVGTSKETDEISYVNHELAHGLYYTNDDYKNEMKILIMSMPKDIRLKVWNYLSQDYHESIIQDEIQAYMATGFEGTMNKTVEPYRKPFVKIFEEFAGTKTN